MEIDENGVVNPLRPPALVRDAARSVGALPRLALAFAALAVALFLVETATVRASAPIHLAEAIVVLYPAAVLWHRRDAATAAPELFRGAILIAASQVAIVAVRAWSRLDPPAIDATTLTVAAG
jgi:hypothetical protein